MSSGTVAPVTPATTSFFGKIWNFLKGAVVHVEDGIEDVFGSKAAQAIEAAGKALIESDFGPLIPAALADATDVATGQMSVSKAVSSLITMAGAAGKKLTAAAALQAIAVAQNSLPVNTTASNTVTPVA
jgi:hypothetical protein